MRCSFDRQWINHSPNAEQGRDNAIQRLATFFADPSVAMTPFNIFAGQGYGFVHFKFLLPSINVTFAAWHSFRFEGTCFVEHWDGVQRIFGNETNPIAFF
jgi:predicted SnoaL-like aldol condensation-catalyzing enzyme